MKYKTWQDNTIQQLKDLLQPINAAQTVFVVGSLANDATQPDFWSDIDLYREEDTRHHRIGGTGNELVAQIDSQPQDYSAGGILATVEYSSQIYDNLAKKWSPAYQANRDPLIGWIGQGREYLSLQEDLTQKDTVIRS